MTSILVTGANGQLGRELRNIAPLFTDFSFHFTDVEELDISREPNVAEYIDKVKARIVINCAAYTAVDRAETDVEAARSVNALAARNLAHAALCAGARLIHVSTDYVFDGTANRPVNESAPVNPLSVYGKTKLEGEEMIRASDCTSCIVRTSWLYSAYGNNFVKTMLRVGSERPEVRVVFDQTGTPTLATDLALALVALCSYIEALPQGQCSLFHYSNEGVCSWYDFAHAIFSLCKLPARLIPILSSEYPVPAPRPAFSVLDKSFIKSELGISVPHWRDSLQVCLSGMGVLPED